MMLYVFSSYNMGGAPVPPCKISNAHWNRGDRHLAVYVNLRDTHDTIHWIGYQYDQWYG